jgi:hypothetical protein
MPRKHSIAAALSVVASVCDRPGRSDEQAFSSLTVIDCRYSYSLDARTAVGATIIRAPVHEQAKALSAVKSANCRAL